MKSEKTERLIKEFSFCTCEFKHDPKSKVLEINYLRSGKVFYKVCVSSIKKSILKPFLKQFNEFNARELFNFNITML
jgi:hypothetical protein